MFWTNVTLITLLNITWMRKVGSCVAHHMKCMHFQIWASVGALLRDDRDAINGISNETIFVMDKDDAVAAKKLQ